jgi:hypothetical protein
MTEISPILYPPRVAHVVRRSIYQVRDAEAWGQLRRAHAGALAQCGCRTHDRNPESCVPTFRNEFLYVASCWAAAETSQACVPKVTFCRAQAVCISSSVHGAKVKPPATQLTNPAVHTTASARTRPTLDADAPEPCCSGAPVDVL